MADTAAIADETGGVPHELGDRLDSLLAGLRGAELKIGPREYVAAHQLTAELVARGRVKTLADLRHALQPLLARSAVEREAFALVFDAHAPEVRKVPDGAKKEDKKENTLKGRRDWRWLWPLFGLLLLTAVVGGLLILSPSEREKTETNIQEPATQALSSIDTAVSGGAAQIEEEPPQTGDELLDRIEAAAKQYSGAPTLEELAKGLAAEQSVNQSAEAYALKLHEWTGLPLSVPIALYGRDGRNGLIWAKLALALARFERPGIEHPNIGDLLKTAQANLSERNPGQIPISYRLAALLPSWLNSKSEFSDKTRNEQAEAIIKSVTSGELTGADGKPIIAYDWQVQRALAILPELPFAADASFHRTAHWRTSPRPKVMAAHYAWSWAPLIAFLFPVHSPSSGLPTRSPCARRICAVAHPIFHHCTLILSRKSASA